MGDPQDHHDDRGSYASPPCMAGEVAPDYFDPDAVDPQQARDVTRWRKAERTRLRAARHAMSASERKAAAEAIAGHVAERLATMGRGLTIGFYWPIKDEPDLRGLMTRLQAEGADIALPVVEEKARPLVYRRWTPEARMMRGDWDIPVPPADAHVIRPDVMLAPLVGWDAEGYRLGYGGGYFDRTLAAFAPRPATIGVGYEAARLATIFPQPHDISLDAIITERGLRPG